MEGWRNKVNIIFLLLFFLFQSKLFPVKAFFPESCCMKRGRASFSSLKLNPGADMKLNLVLLIDL